MTDIQERGYTSPDVLVATDWVAQNLENPHRIERGSAPLSLAQAKERGSAEGMEFIFGVPREENLDLGELPLIETSAG